MTGKVSHLFLEILKTEIDAKRRGEFQKKFARFRQLFARANLDYSHLNRFQIAMTKAD